MMVVALLSWWYTTGWAQLASRVGQRMGAVLENFSVGLLLRTLFDPYRQIDAGQVRGGLDAQLRAWGNRTFSRLFGAVVRGLFVVVGSLGSVLIGLFGCLQLMVWPLVPVLPLIGLVMMLVGWLPL